MPKQGKPLERLIASIERVLGDEETVRVESPKRLPDRTTGKLREHDIVLTMREGHHSIRVAIECRDRSRPVGVPQVEAFGAKCQDTGINQGVIVSPSGFRSTARKKAGHLGIRCLDLEEVDSFDWMLAPGFLSITVKLLRHEWKFFPEKGGLVARENMEVLTPEGNVIEPAILAANAQRILNERVSSEHKPTDKDEISVRVEGRGLMLRNSETGATTPVKFAGVKLTYAVTHELIPFRLTQYRDKDADMNITDVATAELRFGDRTGNLMIVYKEDTGGHVVFVPNPPKNT
jgi:Restriction endonuclease